LPAILNSINIYIYQSISIFFTNHINIKKISYFGATESAYAVFPHLNICINTNQEVGGGFFKEVPAQ
jgi:hypothetical protein